VPLEKRTFPTRRQEPMSIPTILVIEDNPAEIGLLRHALDQLDDGYLLEVLPDGEAALRFVEEHRSGVREPHPCVILLDLYLPKHDGLAVLEAIRREPVLRHISVIVLSGLANPRDQQAVREMGALYRSKPASLDHYVELAAEIIALCKGGVDVASPVA
jgi:CheY-like chemotaxis protein